MTDIAKLCERLRDRAAFCKDCGGVTTYDEGDSALDNEAADLIERLDAMLAASPQGEGSSAEAQGWRDIATAPRDGDDLLVSDDETGARHVSYWTGECWSGPNGFKPTHWQPLPTAPSAHPAPIKPSGDTGELRERVLLLRQHEGWLRIRAEGLRDSGGPGDALNAEYADDVADAILDLIQSERAGSRIGKNDQPGLAFSDAGEP